MTQLIFLAMLLNIVVLVPVVAGLLADAPWAVASYGAKSPARDILVSVYIAFATLSALLIFVRDPKLVAALLMIQVIYKLITAVSLGVGHPVVTANLMIAAFHSVVLLVIWRAA